MTIEKLKKTTKNTIIFFLAQPRTFVPASDTTRRERKTHDAHGIQNQKEQSKEANFLLNIFRIFSLLFSYSLITFVVIFICWKQVPLKILGTLIGAFIEHTNTRLHLASKFYFFVEFLSCSCLVFPAAQIIVTFVLTSVNSNL